MIVEKGREGARSVCFGEKLFVKFQWVGLGYTSGSFAEGKTMLTRKRAQAWLVTG